MHPNLAAIGCPPVIADAIADDSDEHAISPARTRPRNHAVVGISGRQGGGSAKRVGVAGSTKYGCTNAPLDFRNLTTSRRAITQDFSPSVITTILVNGRAVVQKFSIVVPPNGQQRISTEKSSRTMRRVDRGS